MTTLPATLTDAIEAQAMAFARGWIARAREGNFIGLGCAPLHPEAGRLFLRRLIKVAALGNPFAMTNSQMLRPQDGTMQTSRCAS